MIETTRRTIHVAEPALLGKERAYVLDALDRGWLSQGEYVQRFEQAFAEVCQVKHAIAVSSGTAALHLALESLHLTAPWCEVIVPATTFIATANAVRYAGAKPVIVDVGDDWTIDPAAVERAITPNTRAIVAVHLYGQPCAIDALRSIARRRSLWLIEDAAEAHGAAYHLRPVGGLGDVGCFSFYANKIVTCGEGGMVTTNDDALAERIRHLRGQAQTERRYWHDAVGYNYRMTDLQAAVGLGQVEMIENHLQCRLDAWECYIRYLPLDAQFQPCVPGTFSAHWMVAVELPRPAEPVAAKLADAGIETRPVFPPLHHQPAYEDWQPRPNAERLYERGLVLPTHAKLTEDDVRYVCEKLAEAIA